MIKVCLECGADRWDLTGAKLLDEARLVGFRQGVEAAAEAVSKMYWGPGRRRGEVVAFIRDLIPAEADPVIPSAGITHYVGDSCSGGHRGEP